MQFSNLVSPHKYGTISDQIPVKPTAIKKLKGTLQNCRSNPNEPMPPREWPVAQSHVSAAAKKIWPQVCQILDQMNVLTSADLFVVEAFCETLAEQRAARAVLKKHGAFTFTTEGRHGPQTKSYPEVGIVSDCDKRLKMWMSCLGLTPADRSRVDAATPQQVNEFDIL